MPTVALKQNVGKHRLPDGTLVKPGQEIEVSEATLANAPDKFERSLSAAELRAMAEDKAAQEEKAAEEARKRADQAKKALAAAKKADDSQGKR